MLVGATGTALLQPLSLVSLSTTDPVSQRILQRLERMVTISSVTFSTTAVTTAGRLASKDLHRVVNTGAHGGPLELPQAGPLPPRRLVAPQAGLLLRPLQPQLGQLPRVPQHRLGRLLRAPQPQPGLPPRTPLPLLVLLTLSAVITPPDPALALLTTLIPSVAQVIQITQPDQATALTLLMEQATTASLQAQALPPSQTLHPAVPPV